MSEIKISRKPNNVRFGSRAWAASLPADKWQWNLSTRGDGDTFLDISNDGQYIVCMFVNCEDHPIVAGVRTSMEYGGKNIGMALYGDLCEWAKSLDLDADDSGELMISSKQD